MNLSGFGVALLEGALVTIEVALCSLLFGLSLGVVGGLLLLSKNLLIRQTTQSVTALIKGIPDLVLILLVYFGGSIVLNSFLQGIGFEEGIEVDPFGAAVFALGISYAAFSSSVFRGAIEAIPPGQREAAFSLGMSRFLVFRRIVLPQVWKFALPGLGNLFLILLKETSLVSVIGAEDLMRQATYAASFTHQPFTFYFAAAVIYLALTALTVWLLRKTEIRKLRVRKELGYGF